MKNKSRNLERFVGINLTSAMEEVLHDNDHEKKYEKYIIATKEFQEKSFKNFSTIIKEKYENMKPILKEQLFEKEVPKDDEIAIKTFKQVAYEKLKEVNEKVSSNDFGIANRKELEDFVLLHKEKMLLTKEEKKELLDNFKEEVTKINLEDLKKVTIYDTFKENFDKIKPYILTEVNEQKNSQQKTEMFVENGKTSVSKLNLILDTLKSLELNEDTLINIDRKELLNNSFQDTIIQEVSQYNTPIMRNVNIFSHDFNLTIKDKIKEQIEPILEKANGKSSLIIENLKELYSGIGMELNLAEELGIINHNTQKDRVNIEENIIKENCADLQLNEKAVKLIKDSQREFNDEIYSRDHNEFFGLRDKLVTNYEFNINNLTNFFKK